MKKRLWHFFSAIIEFDKPWETTFKGPQNVLTITVEVKLLFFFGYRRLLETQFLEKKGNLSSEENILPNFFSFHRVWQTSGDVLEGSKGFSDNYCRGHKIISVTPKRMLKKNIFEKKG